MQDAGLYLHIPFCRAKCSYCDFNSYSGLDALFEAYTNALVQEIEQTISRTVPSMYIGGGTPTVLPISLLARIIRTVHQIHHLPADAEVTIEANPSTVSIHSLQELVRLGINRLSLGVQSLDDHDLMMLGRIHTTTQAVKALESARQAGFRNINLDLIYGLPGQTLGSWQRTLDRVLELGPDHLSLYALSVEPHTPLARAIHHCETPEPDPDTVADMYELAQIELSGKGYMHYELSNWAYDGTMRCQHNLMYWHNQPYIGLGAGAHSWFAGQRWANTAHPEQYITHLQQGEPVTASHEDISLALEIGETMMLGLRLVQEGVPFERFLGRFGIDLRKHFAAEIDELLDLGLIILTDQAVKLSPRGRLLGNQVFARFLPDSQERNTL